MKITFSRQVRSFIENNLSLSEALSALILCHKENAMHDPLLALIAQQYCRKNGIAAEEDEIDETINQLRKERKLFTAEDTETWLATVGISDEDLRDWAIKEVQIDHFRESIAGDGQIERYFSMNRLKFDEVDLYRIVCQSQATAQELRAQCVEGESFFELAHKYSTDQATKAKCGYLGRVRREKLVAEVESQAFASSTPKLIGPVKVATNYHLYKVEGVYRAELTDSIREEIGDHLFNDWAENSLETWLISQLKDETAPNHDRKMA